MQDDQPKPFDPRAELVRKVARETGLSENEINDIISLVGFHYASIVREARVLKQQRK